MEEMTPDREARRNVLKKMAYVAPIVLSLAASTSFARSGSGNGGGGSCSDNPPPPGCN
jgi:hypothetical protein